MLVLVVEQVRICHPYETLSPNTEEGDLVRCLLEGFAEHLPQKVRGPFLRVCSNEP